MSGYNRSIFTQLRTLVLVFILCCAAVVLGMEANFAKLLPYDSDFIIFGLVVSCVTVLFALGGFLRSTPAGDSICFFIFGVLWVAMGGFSVDRIGGVRCIDLVGQPLNTGNTITNATASVLLDAETHCKQLKVIMAFSWAEFAIMTIMFIIVTSLTIRARSHGAHSQVWNESISDLPWFGTWVGEDRQHYQPRYPMPAYPPSTAYPPGPNGTPQRIVIQAPPPGESVYLRPEDGYMQPVSGYRP